MKFMRVIGLALLMIGLGATSCFANFYKPINTIKLGQVSEQYDWPQGLAVSGSNIYVMDGTRIKEVGNKKIKEIYNLESLRPAIENLGIKEDNIIRTFRLAQMQTYNGYIYVSGLLFDNREDEKLKDENLPVRGDTYTILFTVKSGVGKIIHLNKSKQNLGFMPMSVFETKSGGPEDLYSWGEYQLYDYGKYITYPQFTFAEGALVYVRQQVGDNRGALHEVVSLKSGKEKVLFEWYGDYIEDKVPSWHYVMPVLKGTELQLFTGMQHIHYINLVTNQIKTTEWHEMFITERPRYRNGTVSFLNDERFFLSGTDGFVENFNKEDIVFDGSISGYDFDGKKLYLLNYDNRTISIFKLKP